MLLTVLDNAYFLSALGWAVGNSLWQSAVLWLIYKLLTFSKNQSALFRYNLSTILLFLSFGWFVSTLVQNYFLLKDTTVTAISFFGAGQFLFTERLHVILPFMSLLYLALLSLYLFNFTRQYLLIHFLRSNGLHRAPVAIRLFIRNTAVHLGIKKKVAVWISDKVDVPAVIGILKPVVLLPAVIINNLTTTQVETILLHELAHIKRNDFLLNLCQSVIEALLFFNPFVIMLGKAIKQEREHCCDDWVLNYQYNKHDYASALLVLEQQRQQQLAFAVAATNGKKALLKRVKRLFYVNPQTGFRLVQKLTLASFSVAVGVVIFAFLPLYTKNKSAVAWSGLPAKARFASLSYSQENRVSIVNAPPVARTIPTKRPALKPVKEVKEKADGYPTSEYVLALINEKLLRKDKEIAAIAMQAAEKAIESQQLFVKVEEEQSGKKQKRTYYFELTNKDGTPEIKPLLVFNQYNKAGKTSNKRNLIKKSQKKRLVLL